MQQRDNIDMFALIVDSHPACLAPRWPPCPAGAHAGEAGRRTNRGRRAGQEYLGGQRLPEGAGPCLVGLWLVDLRGAVRSAKVVNGPGASGPWVLLQKGGEATDRVAEVSDPCESTQGQARLGPRLSERLSWVTRR